MTDAPPLTSPAPSSGLGRFVQSASPEALFVISGICQYTGATIAVNLFDELRPATVAWMRVLTAAAIVLVLSVRSQRRWTRPELIAAALFGATTGLMNLFFYLSIDRLALGKSVVIEFVGPIAVAAVLTRTARNTVALLLAVTGVIVLSGVEIGSEPLGLLFILIASGLWAGYIVLGRRVAHLDRGMSGMGVGLLIGSVLLAPSACAAAPRCSPARACSGCASSSACSRRPSPTASIRWCCGASPSAASPCCWRCCP